MIDYRKELQFDKLSISEPQKKEDKWVLHVLYDDAPFSFQTPSMRLNKEERSLLFDSCRKNTFFKFIDSIEEVVVDYLNQHSERLFKGKLFSKEKLKQSLMTSWIVSDEGVVSLNLQDSMLNDTKYLSAFGDIIDFNQLTKNVVSIFTLDSINFSKSQFELKYKVTHMKSKRVDNQVDPVFETKSTLVEDDKVEFFNE